MFKTMMRKTMDSMFVQHVELSATQLTPSINISVEWVHFIIKLVFNVILLLKLGSNTKIMWS